MIETSQHTPEIYAQTSIDRAIHTASSEVAELSFDPDFQAYLSAHNVRLETDDAEAYWGAVAGYTEQYVGTHETLTPLEQDSFALVANLPLALTKRYHLDHFTTSMDRSQIRQAKETVCAYNGLLKHFVTAYPQQSEQLHQNLLAATLETMGSDSAEFTAHAETVLRETFKGVKHEIGFAKVLDSLGVDYREGTVEEDLKGRDFIIAFKGKQIGVDVKASLDQVDSKNGGATGPTAVKRDGDIVMYTLLTEKDFAGTFQPTEEAIANISLPAGAFLQKAVQQSLAK